MKVIFHERFYEVYATDPAAAPGRMEPIVQALRDLYPFVEAEPAENRDLERVHGRAHIESVKRDRLLFEMALLAAGGAIQAAKTAFSEGPAFGLIRPPGHHASPHSCWGFCYFNNIAVALKRLLHEGKIRNALILDFDLHFGDGTAHIFAGSKEAVYLHPEGATREDFLKGLRQSLEMSKGYDILAISAGFDRHQEDWGGLLSTEDYFAIGQWAKAFSQEHCEGRRFALLEGGYNHAVLGKNVRRFLQGLSD